MRKGFLGSLILLAGSAVPALAQMPPYPYGYGAYPYSTPPYSAMYGQPYMVYANMAPPLGYPAPQGMPYGSPQMGAPYGYAPQYGPCGPSCGPACSDAPAAVPPRKRPRLLGWPPPPQVLPPSNPPPPEVTTDAPGQHPAEGDVCEPTPGQPLTCEESPCCSTPPEPCIQLEIPCAPPAPMPRIMPCGYRWYGNAEFLIWWLKDSPVPPLIATGAPGSAGTVVILNSSSIFDDSERLGARTTIGRWLNPEHCLGIEATGLWLQQRNLSFASSSSSNPTLGVPFINAATGEAALETVAAPGTQTGSILVQEVSRLWSGEANLRVEIERSCCGHVDMLLGFRALGLQEDLSMTDSTTFTAGAANGSSLVLSDRFGTRNYFYGGQVGIEGELNWGRFYLNGWAKLAVGSVDEVVNINGTTLQTGAAGTSVAAPGGLFALPTNIGQFRREEFCLVPEGAVNVGYRVCESVRVYGGWTFLYLNRAVRPGDQIDTTVNTTQQLTAAGTVAGLTGTPRPTILFHDSSFWAQGFNLGLEFRF